MMKKITVVAAMLITSVFTAFAADSGFLGGAFTGSALPARIAAMGGAFTAVANDANASWWNPAGMALLDKKKSFSFTYAPTVLGLTTGDISDMIASYSQGDAEGYGALGASLSYRSINLGSDYTGDPEYKWTEYTALVSYALVLNRFMGLNNFKYPKYAAGINVKYTGVSSDLTIGSDAVSAMGFGADAAVMIAFKENLNIGIMARDIYTSVSWDKASTERLPYSLNAGIYYGLTNEVLLTAEAKAYETTGGMPALSEYCFGGEYILLFGKGAQVQSLSIRAGASIDANADVYTASAGAGVNVENFLVDYSFQYFINSNLNTQGHRIGGTFFF